MNNIYERIGIKTDERMFLNRLKCGFGLPPITCEAILNLMKSVFFKDVADNNLGVGRMNIYAVSEKEPSGKPLKECELVPVVITVDTREDIEVYKKHDLAAYRQHVICRVTEEAFEQGGLLTLEDLVRILKSSLRTIKRDVEALRDKEIAVRTRGYVKDMGRGTSHKAKIVELWLRRYTYTEIERRMKHSLESIKRYLVDFGKVVLLTKNGYSLNDSRFIVGISEALCGEYLKLYERYREEHGDCIEELTIGVESHEFKKREVAT